MAAPQIDEIWKGINPWLTASGLDGYFYKVVDEHTDANSVRWVLVRKIGDTHAAGFRQWIRSEYMDASDTWTLQSEPIP